ncbi:hypothetical protein SAMN05660282_02032 [Corynebacterium spheniscorum]|uniref:Uncharacterized protein n=1 Tax=Corynebacterium spheniscorum TaxID=185761 RepID=A0A1I2UW00_9CORY|nr:hypothetical protein SAMN05660282_02032 [Corynebacterium spheniscorum]
MPEEDVIRCEERIAADTINRVDQGSGVALSDGGGAPPRLRDVQVLSLLSLVAHKQCDFTLKR